MREKPFIAMLHDPTRSFIEGYAGAEFYRLESGIPQRVSHAVANALRDTLYQVTIEGYEPATTQIAEAKQQEGGQDGNGNGTTGSNGSKKRIAKKEKTDSEKEKPPITAEGGGPLS